MTEAENDLLCRVGPGTPMGELLRRYWIPVLQSTDLPANDGAPLRVRLLGENLVAFRTTDGRVGLLDHVCPHRCASLFFGRNEENGLRCVYHGWKFDVDGRCVDTPTEPPGSTLKDRVRATAYPCVEQNGIVWTYMGPTSVPRPALPELGWALAGPERRGTLCYQRACNWLQAMEGDFDSAHLGVLHRARGKRLHGAAVDEWARDAAAGSLLPLDPPPLLEVVETEAGVMYGARRDGDDGRAYWRVTQFLLPFYTSVPSRGAIHRDKVWVPVDDEHTMVWEPFWSAARDLTGDERKGWQGRVPRSGFLPDTDDWLGRRRFAANAANDYLIDHTRQRRDNFSGLEETAPIQDAMVQESMGAICDRAREHLGASDAAIVRMRRRLARSAEALRDRGEAPPGVKKPSAYRVHGDQMVLGADDSWLDRYAARMRADYPASGAAGI